MDVFFHVGLGKTGSTYLQHKFFPKLKGLHYIKHTKYKHALDIIGQARNDRYFVSREFDRQFLDEVKKFSAKYPDAYPIMVLRRQDSWIASQYRRFTKNGRGLYFNEFVDLKNNKGRWDIGEMEFYPKIEQLEHYFSQKPLVLLYEELRNNPEVFFQKIANYSGSTFDINHVSLKPKHSSYSEKQLLVVRRKTRKLLQRFSEEKIDSTKTGRRLRKIFTHLLMYFHWLAPKSAYANETLIDKEDLNAIREHFKEDWAKCMEYIELNAPTVVL